MAIISDFKFGHVIEDTRAQTMREGLAPPAAPTDFRGDLVFFLDAPDKDKGSWAGPGFNLIWRPDFEHHDGNPNDFFLELNETKEILTFQDITGGVPGIGIANRGAAQKDIQLGGIAYTQQISDSNLPPPAGLHFEPGVWINVEATTNPLEKASISRMGSIPHGTTINLQGDSTGVHENPAGFDMSQIIKPTTITPSQINPNDPRDETSLVPFPPQENIDPAHPDDPSRTKVTSLKLLDQARLQNPNQFLLDAVKGQTITKITTFIVASDVRDRPGQNPDVGGGVANIAFLTGNPTPNGDAMPVSAIFWLEEGTDAAGNPLRQIQYTQRVLLKFNGLNWPHVTVGTLVPAPPPAVT